MEFKITGSCSAQAVRYYQEKGLYVENIKTDWNDKAEIVRKIKGYDCWLNFGQQCDKEMLEALAGSLKMICRNGIGYDQIDIETATRLGICVTNTAGSMNQSVGEAAVILILETLRKFYLYNRRFAAGVWERGFMTNGLDGKTIGFVGFGGIGQQCARYLSGFDCKLLVYDEYQPEEVFARFGAKAASMEELAEKSDIVTIHCPLTEQTKGMINMSFFKKMKNSAVIINTARGPIINEKDLVEALRNGVIGGAGLDVYEEEPLDVESPLLHMDQVFALPHVGSFTKESSQLTNYIGADNIIDFCDGKMPRNCVNPDYIRYVRR